MTKLEELLEGTEFTKEEYQTYRKVEKHYQLEDLLFVLNDKLRYNAITQEQYDYAVNNADAVIEKYNKWIDYDWFETMECAVSSVIRGE